MHKLRSELEMMDAIIVPDGEGVAWPPHPLYGKIAGVSSFGFTGTNAHAIIEEPPSTLVVTTPVEPPSSSNILCLSAKSASALLDLCRLYGAFLDKNPQVDLSYLCYSHNTSRHHFKEYRTILIAGTVGTMRDLLNQYLASPQVILGPANSELLPLPFNHMLTSRR